MSESGTSAMQTGMYVFIALGVLTIVEYIASSVTTSAVVMFIIALIKAALIVNYFMHVYRLWREESH